MTLATLLDRVLFRQPFEGTSGRRYIDLAHPAFGDLHARLVEDLRLVLGPATHALEVGAGPATFSVHAAAAHPHLTMVALEPSEYFATSRAGVVVVRAVGERLPLASGSIDVATCISSIRHVRDRRETLRELFRVVRSGGRLVIVELDPAADDARIAGHAGRLGGWFLRRSFRPFVLRTAPTADAIVALAREAGWQLESRRDDALQPVYILELARP